MQTIRATENEQNGLRWKKGDKMKSMSVLTKIDLFLLPLLLLAAFLSALDKVRIAVFHSHLPFPKQSMPSHINTFQEQILIKRSYWDRMHWHMRPFWAWAMTSTFMASNTLSWVQSSILDTCWWSSLQRGCWLTCRLASMSAPCSFCGEAATAWWRHVPPSLAQLPFASFWACWKLEYCLRALWLRPGGIGARSSLSALLYGMAPFQEWVRPGQRYERGGTARSRRLSTDPWRHTSLCDWSYPHGTASMEGMKGKKTLEAKS